MTSIQNQIALQIELDIQITDWIVINPYPYPLFFDGYGYAYKYYSNTQVCIYILIYSNMETHLAHIIRSTFTPIHNHHYVPLHQIIDHN